MPISHLVRAALAAIVLLASLPPALAQMAQPVAEYSPQALQDDLRFLRDTIDRTHPEPGMFVSRETLRKAYDKLGERLRQPLSRDGAWRAFAALNPVFADGHMSISYPDRDADTRAHLAGGGALFPFEAQVAASGEITIRTGLGGAASALRGTRIEQINGVPAAQVARELLALAPGDTPALRAHLLSRAMWFHYWKVFGAPATFDLVVRKEGKPARLRVPGSRTLPLVLAPPRFEDSYRLELLPGKAALLTVGDFLWPDKPAFYAFTRDAFTTIRAAGVTTLIIDIRDNRGGDDDMWKVGLIPYLAERPVRNASSYVKKVIAGRQSGSEQVGDVVHGFGTTWVAPEPANPLRFTGKTYVLVGRTTYSSAVLFSNVVQDFGIGQLVGAGGYARTRQSGGVQYIGLPNTKLELSVPRFILDRPSGEREPPLVHPDIVLADSPLDSRAIVQALLAHIRRPSAPALR